MHVIVCASVCEFRGQNSFRRGGGGGGVEGKNGKTVIYCYSTGETSRNFLDLG